MFTTIGPRGQVGWSTHLHTTEWTNTTVETYAKTF